MQGSRFGSFTRTLNTVRVTPEEPSPTGMMPWKQTVHADNGLVGFTTKHIYFSGPKKKFRVRYGRSVESKPFSDGFGIMHDAQTAKPQSFQTGDGWFAFNLAQM